MNFRTLQFGAGSIVQIAVSAIVLTLLLASCGGGSGSAGDINSAAPPPPVVAVAGPDSFLLFPNPQSSPAANSETYARAYYAAIDPNNDRDTLSKWKTVNGFGNAATGSEEQAVFGDMRDLGYGRYVTARKNADGTIAFLVDNYLVWTAAGYGYSSLNLDAAVARDQRWYIGTNAIEVSPGPNGGKPFAKFYTFDTNGARLLAANLDGRGNKAMPGICTNCYGGRADPLTPPDASGNQLFAVLGNPASGVRGDLKGKLHFFEPDTFSFSTLAGYTRADQEAKIKTLNKWAMCSYPLPAPASGVAASSSPYPEDQCRNVATPNEWQGGAAEIIKAAYGGNGLPNDAYADNYVPASWAAAGQTSLYQKVVQPTCRMCHILRGVGQQADADFSTYTSFQTAADDIKEHVIDRGNMPLTKVLYSRYWATPGMINELNAFLKAEGYTVEDGMGAPLLPGRPVAIAGPDRTVSTGASTLTATESQYADTYVWSIVTNPGDGTLSSASGVQTTFNATVNGTYVVQLIASKGAVQSAPAQLTLVVNSALTPLPSAIRFTDIKAVLQKPGANNCITCHVAAPTDGSAPAPVMYGDIDRNGDGLVNATDDAWFYAEVRGRINFSDIVGSPLLRKPSGHHHNGDVQTGFGDKPNKKPANKLLPGDPLRANYDLFLNWILNGAPY